MLHSMNLDLMRASARHHPDGRPMDPHEHHAHEVARLQHAARRRRILVLLHNVAHAFSRQRRAYSATYTLAQISKQAPPGSI